MLGISSSLVKGGASLLTFVKDNLKLYLDFKSNKSDTLKFPCEGSTSFDASTEKITAGQSNSIVTGNEVTLSCWFKSEAYNSERAYLIQNQKGAGSTNITVQIHGNDGTASSGYIGGLVWDGSSSHNWTTVDGSVDDGKWHHVAFTSTATTQKVYLDGVLKTTETNTFSNSASTDATIIGNDGGENYPFDGKMANVAIWNRVLSLEEVQSVMNKSYSQLGSVEKTSLVMWQSLDSETASGRTPIEQNAKTETAPQETENKIVLNSHGTTTYTQILNESDRTFASQGNWVQGSGTFEFGNTDVYSEGALKISSAGWVYLATNGSGFDTALVSGSIYKIQFTWTVVDTSHAQNFWFGIDSSFGNYGLWRRYQFNTDQLPEAEQVVTIYHQHDGGNYFYFRNTASSSCEFHIKNISCELIGNNVGISNATTTTSVYGGNAPILPRAVDVAKEGQADAIGDGSARFTESNTDFIEVLDNDLFSFNNNSKDHAFSISAWINPIDATRFSIASKATGSQVEWRFYCDENDKLRLFLADDNISTNEKRVSTASISQNTWTHVAVTYDGSGGTSASSGINLYINGILDNGTASGFGTYVAMHNHSIPVNIGFDDYDDNYADGSISQLGIWKGELTQAQIQSIMESTSYSKIPADVKSTLGSERVLNSDFSDGENLWNLNNANVVNEVLEIDEGAFSYYAQQSVDGGGSNYRQFESGYLMKLEIVVDEYTSGGTIIYATGNNIGTFNSAGTHTIYYKPSVNEYLRLRSNGSGFEGKISSVSIKRVTNDIVAYYPLDGSSSRGNGTDDVTTGEVLGNEMVNDTDFTGDGALDNPWRTTQAGWNYNTTENRIEYNDINDGHGAYQFDSQMANSFVAGQLYRAKFTIGGLSSGVAKFRVYDSGLVTTYVDGETTGYGNGTHYAYFVTPSSNISGLVIYGKTTSTSSWYMTEFSIKEVTSNTGVLK
jgi:hypothetical protein